jgi:hypothetical protein
VTDSFRIMLGDHELASFTDHEVREVSVTFDEGRMTWRWNGRSWVVDLLPVAAGQGNNDHRDPAEQAERSQ